MRNHKFLKSTLCLLMALVCNVAWAQTVAGIVGNPTTTLKDGKYVVVAMSDKGVGPCYYHAEGGGRHYRYDLNKTINPGDKVTIDYVWTIDETTEDGVQHITVTNFADDTKFFVKDNGTNQNFGGSEKASLKVEKKTISETDYIALTLDDANIGYIYVNAPGGNPNLSYWKGYSDGGACVKFTFYPVELGVAGENLPLERKSTFAVGDEMYIYSTCRVRGTSDWTGFFTNNNGRASLIKEKPTNLFTEGNDPIWVIASLETLQTEDETPKTYYKVTLKNKATDKYLGIGGVTTNAEVGAPQTFYISQWMNPVFKGDTDDCKGVMPGEDVWSENVDGTALAPGNITANDPIWVVQAATGNCFNTNGRQYNGGNNVAYPIVFYSVGDREDIEQKYFSKIEEVNTAITSAESLFSTAGFAATHVALQVTQADAAGYIKCNNLDPEQGNDMNYLIDNDPSTFIHSNWHAISSEKDYLEVYLGEGNGMSLFYFTEITRGDAQADYASSIEILGSEDGSSFEPITTVSGLPTANTKSYTSPLIKSDSKYKYLRFVVTGSNYAANRPYFHMAEFDLYSVAINEKYVSRGTIFCALNEAVQNGEKAIADLNLSAMNSAKTAMDELIAEGSVTYPFTLTTDDENPVLYAIKSGRTNRSQGWWYTYDPSDQKIGLTQFTMANTQFWYFKEIVKNNKVYLQLYPAAGEGKAMSYNNTNSEAGNVIAKDVNNTENFKSTWLLEVVNGKYGLQTEGRENRLSNNGGVEENGALTNNKMGMWDADPNSDAGSAMYLFEKPKYPFTLTTDDADPQYYGIKSGRTDNGQEWWYTYITEDDDAGKILLSAYTGAKNQMWYFKEVASDKNAFGLQLYPAAGGGKAMSYQNTNNDPNKIVAQTVGTEGWNSTWVLETTNGAAPYGLQTSGKENRLSNNGGTGNNMGMWNASPSADAGSAMYFSDPAATLQTLIDEAKVKAGYGHEGEVGYYPAETAEALRAAIAQAEANKANKIYKLTDLKTATSAMVLILPEAGKYYQIKSANPQFYAKQGKEMGIYSSNASGQLAWKALDATDKSFYWTITPKNGTYVFKNVADDKYVPAIAGDAYAMTETESEAAEFTLTWLAPGQFNIQGNGTMHMAGHSEGAGTSGRICGWNGGINSSSAWTIVEVEDPDLAVAKAALQNKIDELNQIISKAGMVGYYTADACEALKEPVAIALVVLNGGSTTVADYTTALTTLNNNTASLDKTIVLPKAGKAYKMAFKTKAGALHHIVANEKTLSSDTDENNASVFYCTQDTSENDYPYVFISAEGKILTFNALTDTYTKDVNDIKVGAMVDVSSGNITSDIAVRLGTVYIATNKRPGGSNDDDGCFVFKNQGGANTYDGAKAPFHNDNFTSAIVMTEVEGYDINADGNAAVKAALLNIAKAEAKAHVEENKNQLGDGVELGYYVLNGVKSYDAEEVNAAIDAATTVESVMAIKESFAIYKGVKIANKDEFANNGVYSFQTSKGWLGATESCDNVISTAKTSHNATGDHNDPMFQWAVYQSANGNYYLYNLGKQMFMGVQSNNQQSIPFVENPIGRKFTFKQSASQDYPIMFSTDNAGVVNHNGNITAADGVFTWTGGWNTLDDGGSNHQVTLVSELPETTLQEIAAKVEAYDRRLYVTAEVEGSWENNPNTHFGDVTATSNAGTLASKLKTTPSMAIVDYDGLNETTIAFTRAYRGFEFQGFFLGEENLGKSFPLTDEQKASITAENPLVAKFTATEAVTLFYDDDEFSYRIPAIERTSTNRLIAVSDYRHSLDDIGRYNHGTANPGIDLVIRTSDNNGKTWSETKTIAAGTGVRGANDCAYGDAAIAVVGQNVLVMAAAGDVFFPNANASNNNRVVRIWNKNNGDGDWDKEDISTELFLGGNALFPNGYAAFFGSGRMPVDEKGRIYGAMLLKNAAAGNNIYVVYSDDLGDTWGILGGSQTQVARADEPKVEILPNGQILLSARRGGGRHFRVFTYGTGETDWANGVGTWSNTKNGCDNGGSNGTNGEIYHLEALNANGQRVNILLQSQPKGGSTEFDRKDVTIWYKEITETNGSYTIDMIADNWREGLQVSYQKSAYSAMTLQEDGRMAFFFEEAPCFGDDHTKGYSMVYMPLTIEQITKSNYFSLDADLTAEHVINVVLTDAQGNEYCQQVTSTLGGVATKLSEDYPFITLGDNATLESDGTNFTYTNTVTLPFKVSNEETTVWHNMYIPSNTNTRYPVYFYAESNANTTVKTKATSVEYGASDYNTQEHADKMSWAIYNVDNGFAFTFKNKLTGKYIKVAQPASGKSENVQYDTKENATAFSIEKNTSYRGDYIIKHETGHLSVNGAGDGHLTFFSGNYHWGSTVKIVEAPDFEALIAEVNATLGMIGDKLGQYTATEANVAVAAEAKVAMENSGNVKLNTLNSYKNLLNGATLNMPKAGQYFRVAYDYGGNVGKLYMQSTASSVRGLAFTADMGAASIWYFQSNGSDDNCSLYAYTEGMSKNLREHGNDRGLHTTVTNAEFYASTRAEGKYNIKCGSYVHANTSDGKYYTDHCSGNNCVQHDLILEPVNNEYPVTVNASLGFASFYAPVALTIPKGMTAYVVIGVTDDKAPIKVLAKSDEVIPAETGVLLGAEGGGDFTLTITDIPAVNKEDSTLLKSNMLHGTIVDQFIEYGNNTHYMLGAYKENGDIVAGFFEVAKNLTSAGVKDEENGTHFKNKAFKSYLTVPGPTKAAALRLEIGSGTTEIENSEIRIQNSELIFDLQGRRVEHPGKGLYIVNGKKVIF